MTFNSDVGVHEIDERNFMLDDGNGNLYITELIATDKKICELRIKETDRI